MNHSNAWQCYSCSPHEVDISEQMQLWQQDRSTKTRLLKVLLSLPHYSSLVNYFIAARCSWNGLSCTFFYQTQSSISHSGRHQRYTVGWSRTFCLALSATRPKIVTGSRKVQIWTRLSTGLSFEPPRYWNGARCLKANDSFYASMIAICTPQIHAPLT